jgi:hypothetical protein
MFHRRTRFGTSMFGIWMNDVSGNTASVRHVTAVAVLIVGAALLVSPRDLQAQRGGGGAGAGMGGGVSGGAGRPGGVSEKDELKDFHRAMAIQATAEQRAAFTKVVQYTQTANDRVQTFRESLKKASASSPLDPAITGPATKGPATKDRATSLDQAIENARSSNQNFLTSFSSKQRSSLQDATKRLARADSELDKQIKTLDQLAQPPKPDIEQISSALVNLDKALAGFQNEQLSLGREMSILFDAASQDITFSLPPVTNSISVNGQPILISAAGAVSKTSSGTSAKSGQNLFRLRLVVDLSNVQQNITGILRSGLTRTPACGERIEILNATLTPLAPASLVAANLHFERWVCSGPGQGSPMEVSSGDATIEVKLTPSLEALTEPNTALHLVSEITRVEAQGFLRSSLRSGDLGVAVREQIASSVLATVQKGADLKATLPPPAQTCATVQKATFQDAGADQLDLVLDGQLQFSDEQAQQFAAQVKQSLATQGTTAQGTSPQ